MALKLTADELNEMVANLSKVYDVVRTVDASIQKQITYDSTGRHVEEKHFCFDVWNKSERCKNCISAMAFKERTRLSKYEFIGMDAYHVTSQYIEVDGNPCLLEIVEKDRDYALAGAFGQAKFIEQIKKYSEEIYTDSLTGVNNRRYYDEQICGLRMEAVAMIDVDHFKTVNDTYGHVCGDEVLKIVANTIRSSIRKDDSLVRYGGDEFLVAYSGMKAEYLYSRLEFVRKAVENIRLKDYPTLRLSISVGATAGNGTVKELMLRADEALYVSKEERNMVTVL